MRQMGPSLPVQNLDALASVGLTGHMRSTKQTQERRRRKLVVWLVRLFPGSFSRLSPLQVEGLARDAPKYEILQKIYPPQIA